MNWNSSDFTITIPYDPEYAEKANADIEFTLEPKTEFYYRKDNGQKVLVDSLNTEKDYYFMRDGLYHFNEDDGQMHNVVRIFRRGEYELDYHHWEVRDEYNTRSSSRFLHVYVYEIHEIDYRCGN